MQKSALFVLLGVLLLVPSTTQAQSGSDDAFGNGVHAYFDGQYQTAISSFNSAIAKDSNDVRAYYFRGLAKQASGDSFSAESDFQQGAMIEAQKGRRLSLVTRSLERVQGSARMQLEDIRKRVIAGDFAPMSTGEGTMVASISMPADSIGFPLPVIAAMPVESAPMIVSSPMTTIMEQTFVANPTVASQITLPSPSLINPQSCCCNAMPIPGTTIVSPSPELGQSLVTDVTPNVMIPTPVDPSLEMPIDEPVDSSVVVNNDPTNASATESDALTFTAGDSGEIPSSPELSSDAESLLKNTEETFPALEPDANPVKQNPTTVDPTPAATPTPETDEFAIPDFGGETTEKADDNNEGADSNSDTEGSETPGETEADAGADDPFANQSGDDPFGENAGDSNDPFGQ